MNLRIDGRNALVCGASQGIGRALAIQFALMGGNVTIVARNAENLESVCNELYNSGSQNHDFVAADFTEPKEAIKEIAAQVVKKPIHILVNNTGGPPPGELYKADSMELELAFRRQVVMSQMLVHLTVEGMKSENFGRIINIISIGLKQPIPGLGISNTIRGAVGSWAKTISRELAPFGITVNNILPGYTKTSRLESLFESRAKSAGKTPEQMEAETVSQIPAGRLAMPEELGYLAGFLVSDKAAYITGTSIPIDGGFLSCL
ncbi:MAG: 3-oxoacyl-[acyl-carrier protein] reductase [Bacteroidota bacterium]|nr:3-oxoacyl-[acyl-carrier protein] reductase [Bacteroidota bacterium]